ncbi:MAG: lipopolysaccharide biosynthesis protein [Polyangiaceae bacterium]|nr:lipopolysaccharide biosynthesis protein [Polyangiaceae bacterium]
MSEAAVTPNESRAKTSGLADRVLASTIALSLGAVIHILGQIIVVPIGMATWQKERWGEWLSISALVMFLNLTDLGVQTHVVNKMNAHYARGKTDEMLHELHSALRIQGPLAIVVWTIGAVAFYFLPLQSWLGIRTATTLETYLTVIIFGAELLLNVPFGVVSSTYRAAQQLPRAAVIFTIKRVIEVVLLSVLMLCRAPFWAVAVGRVLMVLVLYSLVIRDLHRRFSWFSLRPLGGNARDGLAMLPSGALFLLAALADYLANQGNLMIIQGALGGIAVAQLATHRTIASMGKIVATQLASAIWPELTSLEALGDKERIIRLHRTAAKLVAFMAGIPLLAFFPMSAWVYQAWTMRELSLDAVILGIFILQTILWGVWYAGWTVLMATNRQGRLVWLLAINAFISMSLCVLLVPSMGIRGAAVSMLVADCVIAVWAIPRAACIALGDKPLGFVREVFLAIGLGLVAPALMSAGAYVVLPAGAARALVTPVVFLVMALPLLWISLLPEERALCLRMLDKIRHRLPFRRIAGKETSS